MNEQNKPNGASDYSWALGPKPVPPVNAVPPPATGAEQPGAVGAKGSVPTGSANTGNVAPGGAPTAPWQPAPGRDMAGASLNPGTSGAATQRQQAVPGAAGHQAPPAAGAQRPIASGQQAAYVPSGQAPPGGASQAVPTQAPPAGSPQLGNPAGGAPGAGAAAAGPQAASARARASNSGGRVGMSQNLRDGDVSLDSLLRLTVEQRASDLHLTRGAPPMIRRDGGLRPVENEPPLDGESLRRSVYQILTQKQRERYEDELELDFAYQVPGGSRFRVNLYQQRDSLGAAFRAIPFEIKPLESLGVPAVVGSFANMPRGLVLVTGPTGSGKSTTLASIIDLANRNRPDHIMTVEDPIEFLHEHKRSIVNQREVGEDTRSFANALKHVLRQDPDIILVGEMRDLETISVALTAAETGHLVFATLHTQDAAQTIDRVIDVFPPTQQDQVRVQLAATIQGVVCQTLCKRADGPGRVVATEIMVATPAIRNLIREGKTHQIYSSMQAGSSDGMHSMDQHLADLTKQGVISYETGLEKCQNVADFNRLTGRGSSSVGAGIANMGMGGSLEGGNKY